MSESVSLSESRLTRSGKEFMSTSMSLSEEPASSSPAPAGPGEGGLGEEEGGAAEEGDAAEDEEAEEEEEEEEEEDISVSRACARCVAAASCAADGGARWLGW